MRRHVDQVACVRHDLAQPVAGPHRLLREGRHLHQVDVEVQQARMVPALRQVAHRAFQHGPRLLGAGALARAAGAQVPHLPGRLVHDRLGEDGDDLQVGRMRPVDLAHRLRIGGVPRHHVIDRLSLRIARAQRLDQQVFDGRQPLDAGQRLLQGVIRHGQRLRPPGRIVEMPRQVVVRPGRIGDAPVSHGAGRVCLGRLAEALDRLAVVIGIGPVKPAIEPELRIGHVRRDRPAVCPQVEIVGDLQHGRPPDPFPSRLTER